MSPTWRGMLRRLGMSPPRPDLPLRGWPPSAAAAPGLDALSDPELAELNAILPWNCFTVDRQGRRFGAAASAGKRDTPQAIPDPRIESLHRRFPLTGRSVLEIGCFEGVHTAALCALAGRVVAVDARVENVVKTIVRTAMLGFRPEVLVCDVEDPSHVSRIPEVDVVHHVGVLYHLADPVAHLAVLAPRIRSLLMLDTHVAEDGEGVERYTSGGGAYRYKSYREFGRADVFSGTAPTSKWLVLDDLVAALRASGLGAVEIVETRAERNGARVLLYARR